MGATIALLLIDSLQCGAATPQKITSLARPVGATEIFTPDLKHTRIPWVRFSFGAKARRLLCKCLSFDLYLAAGQSPAAKYKFPPAPCRGD